MKKEFNSHPLSLSRARTSLPDKKKMVSFDSLRIFKPLSLDCKFPSWAISKLQHNSERDLLYRRFLPLNSGDFFFFQCFLGREKFGSFEVLWSCFRRGFFFFFWVWVLGRNVREGFDFRSAAAIRDDDPILLLRVIVSNGVGCVSELWWFLEFICTFGLGFLG